MPHITADDGVKLYYEETGSGTPIVFVHEFGGDYRHWEPQMRYFARSHRCIAFNARGYPPSDVPEDPEMYSQDRARDDVLAVLDGLGIEKAHINGLSMGGFASLHMGLAYPERCLSLVVAGCGYGAKADVKEQFVRETTEVADRMENETMAVFGKVYALGPTRVQFQNKDPRGWQEFEDQICEHSSLGSANTMRGVQRRRPSLYDLEDKMRDLTVPTLIMNGDEDDPCLDAGLFMKRTIVSSALVLLPRTGHLCNLEEPALYNQICGDFMARVEAGRWELRDPRSMTTAIISTPEK
jgi:pimeloyl-ACP methyl ester carboxylesterase